jgi:hypothetical protein
MKGHAGQWSREWAAVVRFSMWHAQVSRHADWLDERREDSLSARGDEFARGQAKGIRSTLAAIEEAKRP